MFSILLRLLPLLPPAIWAWPGQITVSIITPHQTSSAKLYARSTSNTNPFDTAGFESSAGSLDIHKSILSPAYPTHHKSKYHPSHPVNKYNPAQSTSTFKDPYSSSVPDPQQINIAWPSQRNPNVTNVPGDFIGFGIETVFLDDFTVGQFSANMMNNIGDRVGERLIIRIGGTSGDEVLFDPNQKETKKCIHGDCPLGSSAQYILGPSYFEAFKAFPNQRFTFQAPMGPRLNISGSMDYVTRAYENIGSDRVAAIALGNEPDLYQKLWGLEYDAEKYVCDARVLADEIIKYFGFIDKATQIFEVGDVSGFGNFDL